MDEEGSTWKFAKWDNDEGEWLVWQRFESIPSSLWFVLMNLCKEHPLADVFTTWYQRLIVCAVCVIGVPIFAVPTGIIGVTLQEFSHRELLRADSTARNARALTEVEESRSEEEVQASVREVELQNIAGRGSLTHGQRSSQTSTRSFEDEHARRAAELMEEEARWAALEEATTRTSRSRTSSDFRAKGAPSQQAAAATRTSRSRASSDLTAPRQPAPSGFVQMLREFDRQPVMGVLISFLSYVSVFVYFYYTVDGNDKPGRFLMACHRPWGPSTAGSISQ